MLLKVMFHNMTFCINPFIWNALVSEHSEHFQNIQESEVRKTYPLSFNSKEIAIDYDSKLLEILKTISAFV